MTKQAGRLVLIKVDTTGAGVFATIGGGQTKSITLNNEQVDVTNDQSVNQWRELLGGAGVKSMSCALKGIFDNDAAATKMFDNALSGTINDYQIIVPGIGTFEGAFQVASCEISGEYKGAVQYSTNFESAGEITLAE